MLSTLLLMAGASFFPFFLFLGRAASLTFPSCHSIVPTHEIPQCPSQELAQAFDGSWWQVGAPPGICSGAMRLRRSSKTAHRKCRLALRQHPLKEHKSVWTVRLRPRHQRHLQVRTLVSRMSSKTRKWDWVSANVVCLADSKLLTNFRQWVVSSLRSPPRTMS